MRFLENPQWVENNFSGCHLGNSLRTKRLAIIANNMLDQPEASLPGQNSEWSDTKAAYRLWDQADVTFDAIATPHWQQTRQTPPGRHLLISDTTDINHTSHKATQGLGMPGDGNGRGLQLHSCLFLDCQNQTLSGSGGALVYYRKRVPEKETRKLRLSRLRESQLWGRLVDKVGPPPKGSQWVHVFDRGGDHFEAVCHIVQNRCDWVVRAAKLTRKVRDFRGETVKLSEAVQSAEELGQYNLFLRSRPDQAARTAKLHLSATRVTLPRPDRVDQYVKASGINSIETNVVIVEERNAPKNLEPVRWVLFTSLPALTFEDAWQVVSDYECRWTIEEYHKVMKTGCSIERHALRTTGRLEALTGLISVIGVRLLQLKTFAKHEPETKASRRVPHSWLRALKGLKAKLNIRQLTVYDFFRELAKLGGFLARKGDGEPGWQTIWAGYQKLQLIVKGINIAQKPG